MEETNPKASKDDIFQYLIPVILGTIQTNCTHKIIMNEVQLLNSDALKNYPNNKL